MLSRVHLSRIEPAFVEPEVIDDLIGIYPEGARVVRTSREFEVDGLAEDDPILSRVVERLARGGYTLSLSPYDKPKHVHCVVVRTYEEADFEGVSYFEPKATDGSLVKTGERDEGDGHVYFDVSSARRGMDIAGTMAGSEFYVPTRVKALIESSGLVGPTFVETIPVKGGGFGGRARWKRPGEEWWELTTTIRMPPVSPRMDARDSGDNPVNTAEFDGQVMFYDGLVRPVDFRYTAESLRAMPPFDLARIRERTSLNTDHDVVLIASRRFRDFCREHKLKVDWVPVRVDDADA